jgi:1-deoxy-D-xylulose-5-phosphate reductoisomerase
VKALSILGSTGSIGQSALAVVDAHPSRLRVVALAAGDNVERLAEQVRRYRPALACLATGAGLDRLRAAFGGASAMFLHLLSGAEGLVAAATHPDADIVLCASSGTAALEAVLAAAAAGKTIALANKEVLVMAGDLVTEAARRGGATILPVDSEHNAIHQCLHGRDVTEVRRLILTASGGPFLDFDASELERVRPEQALRHPTWTMGRKITIDSATLMNKGLEVIEARWLFGTPAEQIDVVIHPQSIVHSMVELHDGSVIAQLGVTDMRLPIQYACSYPDRWEAALPSLDLTRAGRLEFFPPSFDRFPCLGLAYRALRTGGTMPVVLNAANEVAVEAFLAGKIGFTAIPRLIQTAMDVHETKTLVPSSIPPPTSARRSTLDEIRRVDAWARDTAAALAGESGLVPE